MKYCFSSFTENSYYRIWHGEFQNKISWVRFSVVTIICWVHVPILLIWLLELIHCLIIFHSLTLWRCHHCQCRATTWLYQRLIFVVVSSNKFALTWTSKVSVFNLLYQEDVLWCEIIYCALAYCSCWFQCYFSLSFPAMVKNLI